MRNVFVLLAVIFYAQVLSAQITNNDFFLLNSKIPKDSVELFGDGIISTHRNEYNITFSPDGTLIMFTIANNTNANRFYTIFLCEKKNGKWDTPKVAPFSGLFSDADPFFSPDGKSVYFISTRSTSNNVNDVKTDFDIWAVSYKNKIFGIPKHLGNSVNSNKDELYPTVSIKGNLFFSTENGTNGYDLMFSRFEDNSYKKPIALSDSINTKTTEFDAFVAPDESYIIYTSMGDENNFGSGDLYISFKNKDNWTKGKNIGKKVNTIHMDQCPVVLNNGRYLFFTSFRDTQPYNFEKPVTTKEYLKILDSPLNGLGNIFCVDLADMLKGLKE